MNVLAVGGIGATELVIMIVMGLLCVGAIVGLTLLVMWLTRRSRL